MEDFFWANLCQPIPLTSTHHECNSIVAESTFRIRQCLTRLTSLLEERTLALPIFEMRSVRHGLYRHSESRSDISPGSPAERKAVFVSMPTTKGRLMHSTEPPWEGLLFAPSLIQTAIPGKA
ncbi:predicted protein [Lichtheimia corymbifera JMRC:FSU:9682]|uniref:Uncharacterized protein n=1 Tax=Lichtheimia corymbifera JMRC:FSU:9682 TaxID=1263082 RepID=A0A068RZ16_9FUNG|nr:predicted protein [Lichtheimia corymbifera JMRC:FSU:9682]